MNDERWRKKNNWMTSERRKDAERHLSIGNEDLDCLNHSNHCVRPIDCVGVRHVWLRCRRPCVVRGNMISRCRKAFAPPPLLARSSGYEEVRRESSDSLWGLMLINRYWKTPSEKSDTSGTIKYRHSKYRHSADVHQTLLSLQRRAWEVNSQEKHENLCGDTYTVKSVKDSVCEDKSDEIYPSYLAETRRAPSEIAKAISKLLNKRLSISEQDIADLPKLSWKSVKMTLSQIFTMKKFSWWTPLQSPAVASNR
jgi:hypothetical protein